MGSMAMSTFMMFVPRHVEFIFLVILCVGFFGIYVPYNESKKKGEAWRPLRWMKKIKAVKGPAGRKRPSQTEFNHISSIGPSVRHRLDQLESLKAAGLIDDREYQERKAKISKEL